VPRVPYPGPVPAALRRALLSHADYYAGEYLDYRLTPDADAAVSVVATQAVKRMSTEGRVDEESYRRAQLAIERLLMRAGPERVEEGFPSRLAQISEADVNFSLKGLCPGFWPIC
jgi:hypothetical protein